MKNVTKMRIIHSVDSNAEKEYIKTFFNYIGLIVYDETTRKALQRKLDKWKS